MILTSNQSFGSLYLDLQNEPDVVEGRQLELRQKIERYDEGFRQALDDDPVGAFHRRPKGDLTGSFLRRGLHRFFGGELAKTELNVPGYSEGLRRRPGAYQAMD